MKKLIVIALLFLTACQGSNNTHEVDTSDENTNVVGGTNVPYKHELTNKVLSLRVGVKSQDNTYFTIYQCTASAIARRVLLTAAHCVSTSADFTRVELRDANGKITKIKAVKAYVHGRYKADKDNDLAIITLENDLPQNIAILRIPNMVARGNLTEVQVAGYGRKTGVEGQPGEVDVLRTTTLKVLNFDATKKIFSVDQTEGKGICQGDSGGPALVKYNDVDYVVGVVSKTRYRPPTDDKTPVDKCNYVGEYVNLQYRPFQYWVDNMITALSAKIEIPEAFAVGYNLK
ncbi:S1 family peptidase [Bdellovibrio svalbardensis]|uniref:Trypsin-like serine protease n=1 Tax=Bdellovibrio svalbardensis TaxID=2972972 RepID=A0ABT6DES3_9BACT|nr:trypsin-like serine protease [Bdellovibrio svalbardensis]MDG0815339.1 trypsin-like serine protease [Bdellovibrio svalbardensis]